MLFSSPPRYRVKACRLIWSWGQGQGGRSLSTAETFRKGQALGSVLLQQKSRKWIVPINSTQPNTAGINGENLFQRKQLDVHLMLVIKQNTLIYVS